MSLRKQIFLIIFFTIIIVVGISGVGIEKRRQFIAEELSKYQELQLSYVTQAAEKVQYSFNKLIDDLYSLSQIPEVQFLEKNTCLLNMVRAQKLNKLQVDSIYRSDKNGKIRYSFPRTDCPVVGDQLNEIFDYCRLTGKSLFQVVRQRKDGSDFLVIAQPVYTVQGDVHLNPSNKFSGILFFITSLNQIQDYFFSSSLIRGRGYPWVITEDALLISTGNVLHQGKQFHEFLPDELEEEEQKEILSIIDKMKQGERGVGRYTYNLHQDIIGNFYKLTAYTPLKLPHQTWSIAVSTPMSIVLDPLKHRIGELRFYSIALVCLIGVMCLISVKLLRNNQQRQLLKLQQKEEENRRIRNQWQVTFDTVDSMVFLLDQNFTIIRANLAATSIEPQNPDALTGRNMQTVLADIAVKKPIIPLSDILENNSTYSTKIISSLNSKIYLMTIIPVKDGSGHEIDLVCYLKDITDMEVLQDQFHRAQKMESIGLMAGGVAHDLNNILSGIVSYPELLLMKLPEQSELRKPIEMIQNSGQRAAAVVDDLLTVARGVASVKSSADVNDIVASCLNSPECGKLKSNHPQVEILTKLTPDLRTIQCSFVHVQKCLMNLVLNGAEAITDRGQVVISSGNFACTEYLADQVKLQPGDYVVLSVADTGDGISATDQERIFEPFYSKKVMGKSGTGLGLTVVWNTMQDHGGMVDVHSGPHGTCFSLYFPATLKEEVNIPEKIDQESLHGNGEHILVVDDQELQREIARQMLDTLGYEITTVQSGEEAIKFLQTESVDLIVLDMVMDPGINGCETYEKILEFKPNQKAVIASGFSEDKYVKKALQRGAAALIKKPYSLVQIGSAVKDALAIE